MEIAPGTLDKFHLGVSADGQNCMMVFVDEGKHTIQCVADFAEFKAFIDSLNRAAHEMARRLGEQAEVPVSRGATAAVMNLASAAFQRNPDDEYIEGALIADTGEVVGIRMCPDVACQVTRAVLMSTAATAC